MTQPQNGTTNAPNPNQFPNPFHEIGQSLEEISIRLDWAEEALAAGRDVNELDRIPDWRINRGRPLHAALEHTGRLDPQTGKERERNESLDLVQWLLKHGADPRLKDYRGIQTPIDQAREQLRISKNKNVKAFYKDSIALMQEAVDKLEGKSLV